MLNRIVGTACLCGVLLGGTRATAEHAVPIEQEPAHKLALQNEHVRVFEIHLPPGASTLLHEHRRDGISVRLSDATIEDQPQQGRAESLSVRRGAVAYGGTPAAFSHRVRAVGETAFHNIYIELLPDPGGRGNQPATGSDRQAEFENDRVRVLRRFLAPGEVTAMHTHASSGVAVPVTSASLEIFGPDGVVRTIEVAAGAVQWIRPDTTHALKNVGDTPVEIVDVELK